MPWCEDCTKYWTPNSLPPDGTCPTCGEVIADPPDDSVPWHFWILLVGVTGYLGWRLVQLFQWLFDNDHALWAAGLGVLCAALAAWAVVAFVRRDRTDDDEPASGGATGGTAGRRAREDGRGGASGGAGESGGAGDRPAGRD